MFRKALSVISTYFVAEMMVREGDLEKETSSTQQRLG